MKRLLDLRLACALLLSVARAGVSAAAVPPARVAHAPSDVLSGVPDAIVDLRTTEGAKLVGGTWRFAEAQLEPAQFNAPGPDRKPTGPSIQTHDTSPHAGRAGFDDSAWTPIAADSLEDRRTSGLAAFGWYAIEVAIPARVGAFDPSGSAVVFEVVADDYSEVWVNGKLPTVLGQVGDGAVAGWNAANRVVLTRDAKPGERFRIAVFTMNAPLSDPPRNYVWIRSATLDFYGRERARVGERFAAHVVRRDPALDRILPPGAEEERVADGFVFTEGPVWDRAAGHLLFSAPNQNAIYRWTPDGTVQLFRPKSGYTGVDIGEYTQPGSNGLTLDGDGRLTIAEMGNRRITRLEPNGVLTVLADRFQGKRFNSPNDLVYRSDGSLYFTDPDFGLPKFSQDPRKELPYAGVFRIAPGGEVQLLTTELSGPNGIAFSPDEKFLYVGNWDPKKKVVMRYPVAPDGSIGPGTVFYDMTDAPGEAAIDGLKVDQRGDLFVTGPGGVWILSPDATLLGLIEASPEEQHNLAWGDDDGRTLYITALTGIYRLRTNVAGIRP